ncbi:MFS transporter [Dictyobacter arantiisoli]|uniref:MFS transporter n=1 Tax=Dictyobacter arantiisoli TaxID=2014874 RepID=A0A5A5T9B2_9CHLR|nr:MFS transporter [Dictyobacter arantiisoli]GCF07504.1 MFS transporter [Dictyobacter arantiisoli]
MQTTTGKIVAVSGQVSESYTKKVRFPALHQRNFRLFWFGQLISLIGTWMQTTGQSWLVLQLTHNSLALGTVGALQFLPILLFTLFGGVLADRLPKRRVLLCTQVFAALLATTLWILYTTHTVQIWHISILAFLLGLNNAFDMPTRQAFVGEMVGRESLPNAVALNSSVFNMAKIVGPGVAGLMIARFGEGPLFLGNALSFIPVLIGLSFIDTSKLFVQPRKVTQPQVGALTSLQQGLHYVKQTPAIFLIIAVVGVVSLFGVNFNVVEPLISTDLLHQGAQGFGLISSSFGFGALIGALSIMASNKRISFKKMFIRAALFCLALGLVGLSHWYLLSIVLAMVTGFCMITFTANANTALQTIAPDHLRGRVMSVYMLVFNGTTPVGNLFTGWLAGLIGISLTLLVNAAVSLIAVMVGWIKRGPAEVNLHQEMRYK